MDHGAHLPAGAVGQAYLLHQLAVARPDFLAVHLGTHAPAGELLHLAHPGGVQRLAPGLFEGAGDGVIRVAFRQGGQLQQLLLADALRVDGGDLEHALGEGAGLVKDHQLRVRQHL